MHPDYEAEGSPREPKLRQISNQDWERLEVVVLDEPQPPALSIDDPSVTEGDPGGPDATITFTITRSGDLSGMSSVAYTVSPGDANNPQDYNASRDALSGTLTFAAGESSKTITLDISDDLIPEGTETFTVTLSDPTQAVITKAVGTGTIVDDDLPTLSIDDPSVTEGDPGGAAVTISFTVTRSGDNGSDSTVAYTVNPGSATTPADYTAGPSPLADTLTFLAGETSKTVTLTITADLIPEGAETFTMGLSSATNAAIVKATGTGTIADTDPQPLPTLSIDDPTITEGNPGGAAITISFTVTRSGNTGAQSSVAYTVNPGTATTPADYTAGPSPLADTLTFLAGEISKTVTLTVTPDLIPEGSETFTVVLSGATNATIVDAEGTGTIHDNDPPPLPELAIDDPTVTEGNPGGPNVTITFTVTRSGNDGVESSVAYTVNPGTAATPADYTAGPSPLAGTLTFLPGDVSKTVTLTVTPDLIPEGPEAFTVVLSDETNATIVRAVGTGTILDTDQAPLPTLSIDDPRVTEGDPAGPNATITFTITPSGNTSGASSVAYTVAAGSATNPSDYNGSIDALTGRLDFAPNQTSRTITLDITDDLVPEGTEAFTVTLSDPTDAVITKAVGTGTIADDDLPPFDIIWTNGGSVVLGSAATPTAFNVGTNAAVPAGVAWTGETASDNWSQAGNWATSSPPGAADTAVFGAAGSGTDVVDVDFQIASLRYSGAAGHITDLANGSTLRVSGATAVHVANANLRSSLAILDRTAVVAHLSELNVGIVATGSGSATGDLFIGTGASLDGSDVDVVSIGRETGASNFVTAAANGSLTLASNSTLTLGSAAAPATLNIGWSQNTNGSASGRASGVLDVLDRGAVLNLNLSELNVGRGSYTGVGTGTLKWNQSEVITAPNVYFGRGNATGILDVPAGGEFLLGTAAAPISLRIAHNDAGNGTATANLNFAQTNPTFTAFIADDLSIGRETGASNFVTAAANGSLTLASNSTLTLGSAAAPATLNIGWSQNTNGSASGRATGVLGAPAGTLTAELSTLNVGVTASAAGTSNGQFIVGNGTTLHTNIANIGVGPNATGTIDFVDSFTGAFSATTINFNSGLIDFGTNTLEIGGAGAIAAQTFNMRGGELTGSAVDLNAGGSFNFSGVLNGTLNQTAGLLAPAGATIATATVNGNYNLAAAGTLAIQVATGTASDRLAVNGSVDLDGAGATGGALDVVLTAAPQLNNSFTIVLNDGSDAIRGTFAGLPDGATFNEIFGGSTFTFAIDYQGGDGNDATLLVTNIASPAAPGPVSGQSDEAGEATAFDTAAMEVDLVGSTGTLHQTDLFGLPLAA